MYGSNFYGSEVIAVLNKSPNRWGVIFHMYFKLTYLRNGFGESDPDVGLAANSNSRSGVFGCSFSSWSFSSSSSSKDLNFGTIGVLSRPGSGWFLKEELEKKRII